MSGIWSSSAIGATSPLVDDHKLENFKMKKPTSSLKPLISTMMLSLFMLSCKGEENTPINQGNAVFIETEESTQAEIPSIEIEPPVPASEWRGVIARAYVIDGKIDFLRESTKSTLAPYL